MGKLGVHRGWRVGGAVQTVKSEESISKLRNMWGRDLTGEA